MSLLQVRGMPDELYATLNRVAKSENRSIAQQTIVLLRWALDIREEMMSRRKSVLAEIAALPLPRSTSMPNPAKLIRKDRYNVRNHR